MHHPVLFLARSWHGFGGMQQLNRDVCRYVGASRSSFICLHPSSKGVTAFVGFCLQSIVTALEWREKSLRVHVADTAALPLGLLCAWVSRSSLSCTACGLDVIYPAWWYQIIIRFCLRRCDKVICISTATAEQVLERGVSRDRITIIPCGIEPSEGTQREREQILLTVGRLVERKGVEWFLRSVFPQLLTQHPDVHYCIVGDGPKRKRIFSVIKKLGLQKSVSLLTRVSDDERNILMEHAMLFVAPNIVVKGDMEGFGIVCIQASDSGLQVASAYIEGLRDAVIPGQTGQFFESGNADDCVRVIHDMLAVPLSPSAVHAATAESFSWSRLVPLYNNVFDA